MIGRGVTRERGPSAARGQLGGRTRGAGSGPQSPFRISHSRFGLQAAAALTLSLTPENSLKY
eukprot:1011483-Prymnesium_polylepis.1